MDSGTFFKKDYSGFKTADFLRDNSFIEWIKYGHENRNLDLYWKIVRENTTGIEDEIQDAIRIVKLLVAENEDANNYRKEAAWERIQSRISGTGYLRAINLGKGIMLRYRAVAAVLGALILLGGALYTGFFFSGEKMTAIKDSYTTIVSPAGHKTEISLPDSSRIWLNSETIIRYSAGFNIDDRLIYLDGEAYFDVEKGKLPFEVRTEVINVRVLGTAFNVKCYRDEDIVEATLVRGSMIVENLNAISGQNEQILLKPNQKVVFSKKTGVKANIASVKTETVMEGAKQESIDTKVPVNQVGLLESYDTRKSTGWIDGLLYLESETLLDLSEKLERRYNVEFFFMSEELKEFKYTGTLREYSLEQVLKAIESTSPVKFKVDENKVYAGTNMEEISNYIKLTEQN